MRASAIFGPGCSSNLLKAFRKIASGQTADQAVWQTGLPATSDEADAILLFGGDGTIHRNLAGLVNLGLPLLIVPAGSGNDFARALGFRSARHSLNAWRNFCSGRKNFRTVDLAVIAPCDAATGVSPANRSSLSPHYFCTVAGVGLDAEVARRAQALPRWLRGCGGYAFTLMPLLFRFAPLPMKMLTRANGGWKIQSDRPLLLAAFANAAAYGGGMKIAPHAKLDDGQLDVCLIHGMNPFKATCLFPTVYFGHHLKIRGVEYFQTSNARLETERPLDVYADGEYVCQTPVEIGVQPAALRVITP